MKKKSLFSLIVLFSWISIAQELPNIIPPSPTVANLMRFEEVPIDNYTGQPNIEIPIYSKRLANDLSLSLSLKYNSSGIRLDEHSGWIGTGWSLFAGGVISRTVIDVPDEEFINAPGYYIEGNVGTFHNGFYERTKSLDNISSGVRNNISEYELLNEYVWKTSNGIQHYDSQPDLFQFNFMGYSGRFIIVNETGTLKPKIISSLQKIKIDLIYTTDFEISSFTVTTPNGYKFLFNQTEQTISYSRKNGVDLAGNPIFDSLESYKETTYTSSWYLSKIYSPSNFEACSFIYQDVKVNYHTPKSTETNSIKGASASAYLTASNQYSGYNAAVLPPRRITNWNVVHVVSKKIKEIRFRDGNKIIVDINLNHPEQDNSTGCTLSKLKVLNNSGAINKVFTFTYKTTTSNRLFLTRMNEKGGLTELSHDFFYNNEDQLPGYDDNQKDRWGYYNGSNNTLHLYKSHVAVNEVTTGVLTGIKYPTGGFRKFSFESNQFSFLGNTLLDPKRVPQNNQLVTALSNSTTLRHNPINSSINNYAIIYVSQNSKAYLNISNLTGSTEGIDMHYLELIPASSTLPGLVVKGKILPPPAPSLSDLILDNLNTIRVSDLRNSRQELSLVEGYYVVQINSSDYYPSQLPGEVSLNPVLSYFKYLGPNQKFMYGGGLRIKEVSFTEGLEEKTKILYQYPLIDNEVKNRYNITNDYSSGSIEGTIVMNRRFLKIFNEYLLNDCLSSGLGQYLPTTHYIVAEKTPNSLQVSMTKGNYVGYKNVEVSQINNGKSIYSYTNAIDFPAYTSDFYADDTPPYYEVPVRDLDYKKGNLIKKEIFNELGNIKSKEQNNYDYALFGNYRSFSTYFKGPTCPQNRFFTTYYNFKAIGQYNGSFPCGLSSVSTPGLGKILCGNPVDFVGIRSAYYDYALPFLKESVKNNYFYDASGNQKTVTTTFSYEYNLDNFQPKIQRITNSKGEQIVTLTKYAKDVNNQRLLDEHRIIDPIQVETSKVVNLTTTKLNEQNTVYKDFGNGLYLPEIIQSGKGEINTTNPLEDRIIYHSYDNKGNPLEVSKKDGTKIYYVWGYQQSQPIAKIEAYTATDLASAQSLIKTAIAASNNDVNKDTENSLRTALSALRNAFSTTNAQVTTFTYDPLIGVTSVTDPRGQTVYYQYDAFNRLESVKDSEGNMVSKNEYNYKN